MKKFAVVFTLFLFMFAVGCASQIQKNQETLLKTAIMASTVWNNLANQVLADESTGIDATAKRSYLKESDPWITELAKVARAGEIPRDELTTYINGFIARLAAWGVTEVSK